MPRHRVIWPFWTLLLLGGCGESRGSTSGGPGAAGDPGPEHVKVVIAALDENDESEFFVCSTEHAAVSLGVRDDAFESPDARYVALEREGAVDIVSLADLHGVRLPGTRVSVGSLSWSNAVDRLAFIADGKPMLAAADGSEPTDLGVVPPAASATYSYEATEWSRDGQRVAFVTRALGIIVNADGTDPRVFSTKMVGPYGTPWAVAFSPDNRHVLGLQTTEPVGTSRSIVVVDTETLASREVEGIEHYSFVGWIGDGSAMGLWDTGARLWLVPVLEGEPVMFEGGLSMPSPATNEVALRGLGLVVLNLDDGSRRTLLTESDNVTAVHWSPDAQILGYQSVSAESGGYLWAADGTRIADGWGVDRDDGWVALPNPENPRSGMTTRDLRGDASTGGQFDMTFPTELSATDALVTEWRVSWLNDDRIAYLSNDGLHIANKDGSRDEVAGPVADAIVAREAWRPF